MRQSGWKAAARSLAHAGLTILLRGGRATRLLPRVRGFYKLRNFYQRILPKHFLVRTKFDDDLSLDLDLTGDFGLYFWHYPNFYEKEEIEAFCSLVIPGCTVLDVGANVGLYTLLAAKRGAQVFAVEADSLNAAMLRHHVKINGFEGRVTVLEIAATEIEKTVSLYRNPQNMGESNILERGQFIGTVAGRTLDSLNLPPLDICKIDVEGAEFAALVGMQQTLKRSPHLKLFVEYAEAFGNSQALLSYLRSHFSTLTVLEKALAETPGEIPSFCNILAER
ncbi:MAG: FkbM family methyltransferase [Candidatus Angelobacter sp.]